MTERPGGEVGGEVVGERADIDRLLAQVAWPRPQDLGTDVRALSLVWGPDADL